MNEIQRSVLVLFGSQTGNSENIAQDINAKLLRENISSRCLCLNDVANNLLKKELRALIIVCSTTGNGDSPDNADKFWRIIKKRSIAKDTFQSSSFCVLALGDTNYDKFCYMGKSIDKRMKELGGHRFLDLHCADEATGLEEVVEEFNSKVVCSLLQLLAKDSSPKTQVSLSLTSDEDELKTSANEISSCENNSTDNGQIIPEGVATIFEVCNFLGVPSSSLTTLPEPSLLLKSRKCGEACIEILQSCQDEISEDLTLNKDGEYSVAHPFRANVLEASWLTKSQKRPLGDIEWGEEHRVIRLELGITGSGIQYQPGDYISIVAPNPLSFVNLMIERVQLSVSSDKLTISADTKIRRNSEILTLQELFQYRLDLVGIPRKACVFALSEHCSDEGEANAMKWLCSKGEIGKKMWSTFFESQCIGIAELLAMFPSCCPPLHVLVSFLSPLTPRPYSIASSPLAHPYSVVIAFSVVRYCCGLSSNLKYCTENKADYSRFCIKRSGFCTSYLEDLLQPFLLQADFQYVESISLRVMWKPSISFRLPGNVSSPLILIGPGTGVAPFIGFLENRTVVDRERSQSGEDASTGLWRGGFELDEACKLPHEGNAINNFIQHVDPGPVFLFYGCRNEDDWIFKEPMLQFLADGTLTALDVALSRQTGEKVYVTHKILEKGKELVSLLLSCNAHVYICGDGNQMAKDVTNALIFILQKHGDLSEERAQEFLEDMRCRRRLLMDVWS